MYKEKLKYPSESNWANNVLDLRCENNLPQNDDNVANMTWPMWKNLVKNTDERFAIMTLFEKSVVNNKTQHL